MPRKKEIEIPIKRPRLSCPKPMYTIINSSSPYFDSSEFSSGQLSNSQSNFNYSIHDKRFVHTIRWKRKHKCCQVLKARLSVKVKSLTGGRSLQSRDAGNDSISIVKNGGTTIISDRIYNNHPFPPGNVRTKSFSLSGSDLDWLNSTGKMSIYIQDDTSVLSIKLKLWICCLSFKERKPSKPKK